MALLAPIAGALLAVGVLFVVVMASMSSRLRKNGGKRFLAQVLVLGDMGRSPRMQYHALSIAECDQPVQIIGYQETPLLEELSEHPNVSIHPLSPPPTQLRALPFLIAGPLKVIWQLYTLLTALLFHDADFVLVQNPPSIPTLAIASFTCAIKGSRLIIDWHNYGWSILAGTRGAAHPFVKVSKWYEAHVGRFAHANLTVTDAMARQLRRAPYKITARIDVLHDRPAHLFRPMSSASERQATLARILESEALAADIVARRTRLIISSTSWTPDEDFGLLLDTLVAYAASPKRTPLLAVITGKGPQKAFYEAKTKALTSQGKLPNITIRTAFLPIRDYAALLSTADLGVCLHKSSSGVDLPMKILDMFGAGLPVVAYSGYESFGELVKEGANGCGFETAEELAGCLGRLLGENSDQLEVLRKGAVVESGRRWGGEWARVMAPVLGLTVPKGFLEVDAEKRKEVEKRR